MFCCSTKARGIRGLKQSFVQFKTMEQGMLDIKYLQLPYDEEPFRRCIFIANKGEERVRERPIDPRTESDHADDLGMTA